MQRSFHLFIHQHANDWYTASILGYPDYAAFGPKLPPLREELREVLSEELSSEQLSVSGQTFHDDLTRRVVELELMAVQHDRLIRVPMRFVLLERPLGDVAEDFFEVRIPRLHQVFQLYGRENIIPWSQEIIRGFFHLDPVTKLLAYDYERGERVERLDVSYTVKKKVSGKEKRDRRRAIDERPASTRHTVLHEVGVELSAEARDGRLPRAFFRERLVDQLLAILDSSHSRSALLTGPSGVGKTALVNEVAHRIALEQVPLHLQEVPLWHVTGGRIIAGMKFLGEWQSRCLQIVNEIRAERGVLFVDSLLELIMAGSKRSGQNVGQFLLPYIQSGEIAVIAEATPDALIQAEQSSPSLVQAFQRLPVASFSTERAFAILQTAAARLEKENRVLFNRPTIARALDLLARFGAADALPGSGLTLISQIARLPRGQARPRRSGAKNPRTTEKTTEKTTDKEAREVDAHGRIRLRPSDAIIAFSRASGFPEALIDPDQLLDVDEVRAFFTERIIGQPRATELLANLITVIKASLNDPERPLGSFLFMGPTGVGKTESALTLAEYLFGSRDRLVRFDMSEYGYPGSAARLVGGGRGEGDLTRKVREQPFCVLLLDEVEKADPEVFDILLQVLGEGRLTDGTGRTVRFVHTIVIMTSNLGAGRDKSIGMRPGMRPGDKGEKLSAADHYREAARGFFRPEFINRIDFLVPFSALDRAALESIARRMLSAALGREGFARRNISVTHSPEVLELLMTHGFDPRHGARPMKRAVEQHILSPLSRRLVLRETVVTEEFSLYVHQGRVEVVSSRSLGASRAPLLVGLPLEHDNLWQRALREVRRRLQDWDESATMQRLRSEQALELPERVAAMRAVLGELETRAGGSPSTLADVRRAELIERVTAFDKQLAQLEWQLCLATLPRVDRIAVAWSPISADADALDMARNLAYMIAEWARARGFAVETSRAHSPDDSHDPHAGHVIAVQGPHAGTILRCELGRHRIATATRPMDILASEIAEGTGSGGAREGADAMPIIREYTTVDAPMIWDATTGVEKDCQLDALSGHLEPFLLARLCHAVASGSSD